MEGRIPTYKVGKRGLKLKSEREGEILHHTTICRKFPTMFMQSLSPEKVCIVQCSNHRQEKERANSAPPPPKALPN